MSHTCHAHGCKAVVPPALFMCKMHWYRVPARLRQAIWKEYRQGQEIDKRPSARYMAVQRRAVGEVAFKPFDADAAAIAAEYIIESERWRKVAIERGQGDPLAGVVTNGPAL